MIITFTCWHVYHKLFRRVFKWTKLFFTINYYDYFKVETNFLNFVYAKATLKFLMKLTAMGDVSIVTVSQGLEWIKNPTTLDKIKDFKPWKCNTLDSPSCLLFHPHNICLMGACATALPYHKPGWKLSRKISVLGEIELQLIASQLCKTNNFYAIC